MAKPVKPEPKIFLNDNEFHGGSDLYLKKYFSNLSSSTKLIGEKGTSYIEHGYVAERISSFFKEAKIIVVLRNPIDRALSNYFFSVENKLETRTLRQVFIEEMEEPDLRFQTSVSPFNYLGRGHYTELIEPFYQTFKENMKIIFFEELLGNMDMVQSIYRFLDVRSDFIPSSLHTQVNKSSFGLHDESDKKEVIGILRNYYRPHIEKLEDFMKRKIYFWYDKI